MNLNIKNILPHFILLIGLLLFILEATNNNLINALIYLTSTIIFWVFYGLILNNLNIYYFARIISFSGLLLAITILCIYGIEQVPYPIGAFIIHPEGIAGSLGLALFSTFPLIIIYQLKKVDFTNQISSGKNIIKKNDEFNEWEIATEEDLLSGEYEI